MRVCNEGEDKEEENVGGIMMAMAEIMTTIYCHNHGYYVNGSKSHACSLLKCLLQIAR